MHQIILLIQGIEHVQIFIVIVGQTLAMFVYRAAQHCMCQWIAACGDFISSVDKRVRMLRRIDRVEHDGERTAGRIFHAGRHIEAAYSHTVLLIFYGARPDGYVGEDIFYITPVVGVEHLVSGGHLRLFDGMNMHFAHGDQAAHEIRLFLRIRLADDSFVALAGGAGFVCIDSGDQDKLVLNLLIDAGKAADVVAYGIFVVCRTGTDDDQEFVALSGDDIPDLCVTSALDLRKAFRYGELFPDLIWSWQFRYEMK